MVMSQEQMNSIIANAAAANEKKSAQRPKEEGVFKPKSGQNIIRILPPTAGMDVFYIQYKTHFNVGPGNNSAPCQRSISLGNHCPICTDVSNLYNGSEDDVLVARSMKAKDRYKSLVIDINNPQDGVQVYEYGPQVFGHFANLLSTYGDFTDLDTGRNVVLTKTGEGLNTKYFAAGLDQSTIDRGFLTSVPDLISTVEFKTNEDLVNMLSGAFNLQNARPGTFPQGAIPVAAPVVQQVAQPYQQAAQPVQQAVQQVAPPAAVQTQMAAFQQPTIQAPAAMMPQTQQVAQPMQQVAPQIPVNTTPAVVTAPVLQPVVQQPVQQVAPPAVAAPIPAVVPTGQPQAPVMPATTEEILARMNTVSKGGTTFVQ